MEDFNGSWTFGEIPDQFVEILKRIGYGKLQRKWLKTKKLIFKNHYQPSDQSLKVKVMAGGGLYRKTNVFHLDGRPREFTDDCKNRVIETARWIPTTTSENNQEATLFPSMEIATEYPELGFTVINLRQLVDFNKCYYKIVLTSPTETIMAEMDYIRHKSK